MAYNLGMSNPFLGQNNPYLQANIDAVNSDVTRQYQNTVQPGQASAQVGSGSFGNSGLQQMKLQDQQNLQKTLANNSANMRMQDYNQQQDMYKWQNQFDQSANQQAWNQNMGDKQFGLQQGAQNFNQNLASNQNAFSQDLANRNYGLTANQQGFNQSLARDQFNTANNQWNQNFGLAQNQQAFNQDFTNRNFDANQYWTGQNFDANRFDTSFNQNQQNLQNYMSMLNQANTFGQQDITNGTAVQNTPLDYFNQFSNVANTIGGYGGTSTSTQAMPGNPWLGALGGWSLANSYKG